MTRGARGPRIEEEPMHGTGARVRRRGAAVLELPCRREPELFFAENPEDLRRAKALCQDCPARAA